MKTCILILIYPFMLLGIVWALITVGFLAGKLAAERFMEDL